MGNFLYDTLSACTLLQSVMSQQQQLSKLWNCTQISQNLTFHENISSLYFYTEVHVHVPFMYMYIGCSLVISQILAEFRPERATYKTMHHSFSLLSKFAKNFTVGFLNLLSTYTIHIVVWGNFPLNVSYIEFLASGAASHRKAIK